MLNSVQLSWKLTELGNKTIKIVKCNYGGENAVLGTRAKHSALLDKPDRSGSAADGSKNVTGQCTSDGT